MAKDYSRRTEFGIYLAKAIKDAKMTQYEFYSKAEIAKPYFYDIISGIIITGEIRIV